MTDHGSAFLSDHRYCFRPAAHELRVLTFCCIKYLKTFAAVRNNEDLADSNAEAIRSSGLQIPAILFQNRPEEIFAAGSALKPQNAVGRESRDCVCERIGDRSPDCANQPKTTLFINFSTSLVTISRGWAAFTR
jgi:hypothetical protein